MITVLKPFAVLAILVAWQPAAARTWHIRADGSGEAPTIQAGHDSATAGDSVLVSWGSYHEHITIDRMIYLVSEVGPLYTLVDGGGTGRVLTILSSATPGPFLSGFTLQNGYDSLEGGGVWVRASGTVIRECHIINNNVGTFDSGLGGGVSMAEVSGCVIEECLIRGNYAGSGGGGIVVGGNAATGIQIDGYCKICHQNDFAGAPPGTIHQDVFRSVSHRDASHFETGRRSSVPPERWTEAALADYCANVLTPRHEPHT